MRGRAGLTRSTARFNHRGVQVRIEGGASRSMVAQIRPDSPGLEDPAGRAAVGLPASRTSRPFTSTIDPRSRDWVGEGARSRMRSGSKTTRSAASPGRCGRGRGGRVVGGHGRHARTALERQHAQVADIVRQHAGERAEAAGVGEASRPPAGPTSVQNEMNSCRMALMCSLRSCSGAGRPRPP